MTLYHYYNISLKFIILLYIDDQNTPVEHQYNILYIVKKEVKNLATNNYSKESILYGGNENIPPALRGEQMINDDLMRSVGLYSKSELNKSRFSKFSRFGRPLDPYGRVNAGREYLFFVKPDLHICAPNGSTSGGVYDISGASGVDRYSNNGLVLNPQLTNNPYFRDLIDTHPDVIKELQYSVSSNDPFGHLLSFSVSSSLPLDSSTAKTMDNPSTVFGTTYNYLQDSEASDEAYTFSLEFVDNKYLDTYHFFKAYSEYHIARKTGLVTPPSLSYYQYKRLHNTMGVYKFIVAEDAETILYWAYLWGVIPTSCPREAFQDASFADGLTFSVNFEAAFIEDMNPMILYQFNKLMKQGALQNVDADKWLPTVRQNRKSDYISGISGTHSYDTSIGMGSGKMNLAGTEYDIGPTDLIDGTLPRGALVDGRRVENEERLKYRLRWYA